MFIFYQAQEAKDLIHMSIVYSMSHQVCYQVEITFLYNVNDRGPG